MTKRIICIFLCLGILFLLNSCSQAETFSSIEVGENFGSNRDGYFKKISEDYCLFVLKSENTRLLRINENDKNKDFFNESVYNNAIEILNDHYISGYFNDDYLILCEEKEVHRYLSFNFKTEEIVYYDAGWYVFSEFNFGEEDMFALCDSYK